MRAAHGSLLRGGVYEAGVAAAVWLAAMLAVVVLAMPMMHVAAGGASMLSVEFVTASPASAGRAGGIGSVLLSTLLIVAICVAASAPIALGTAVLLTEFMPRGHAAAPIIRGSLDILAGVPSIVFGLFGVAFFCRQLGLGYSILAGGLTLACMVLPVMTRTFCSAFEATSSHYRAPAAALGLSRTAMVCHIALPVALPGLTAGFVLGLTRALAETAVLLFTSGYADRFPESVMDSGRSVSVHIYELATNVPGAQRAASASALVLLLLLAVVSVSINLASRRLQRKLFGIGSTPGR
ncbi:Phosphate transport system permease protein PstA [compost metagenome]|jgi:phosphate transport system permease protein